MVDSISVVGAIAVRLVPGDAAVLVVDKSSMYCGLFVTTFVGIDEDAVSSGRDRASFIDV